MSNAIPVDSPAEARNHVISFLLRRTEENLLLKLSWDDLTKDIRHVLEKASGKKLCNWEYDPEYRILKVKARVSPLHAAFNACISRFIIDAVSTTLTRAEARCLVLNPKPVCLSRTPEISPGHKPAAWWKHPDCMIYFGERGGTKEFLRIVVEVGLSESYCDLVRDASQWLLRVRSASQPELVIIAKINEDKDQLDSHQKTQQFENTRNQLIAKYGDEMSQATHDIGSTPAGIQASSPSLLEAIGSEVVESDWVGQISAFVEVWVLRGGQPTQREARIVSLTLTNEGQS
jgi:hypothetical protein